MATATGQSAAGQPAATVDVTGAASDAAIECQCCGRRLGLPEGVRERAAFACAHCGLVLHNDAAARAFRWEGMDPYVCKNGASRAGIWGGFLGALVWLPAFAALMLVRGRFALTPLLVVGVPYLLLLIALRVTRARTPAVLWMMQLWAGLGAYCVYLGLMRALLTDWTSVLETVGDISPALLLMLGGGWLALGLSGMWLCKRRAARLPQAHAVSVP